LLEEESEYPVTTITEALGISRSTYYRKKKRYERGEPTRRPHPTPKQDQIRDEVRRLCRTYPKYGYRRIWANLRHKMGVEVSEMTVYRVMRDEGLLQEVSRYEAKRTRQSVDFNVTGPNQVWQTDMTKVWTESQGWVSVISIIDTFDRRIVASRTTLLGRSKEARDVLDDAVQKAFPQGVRGAQLKLVTDNGSQFISKSYIRMLKMLQIEHIRTSYKHPQSIGMIERWHRSLKEEEVWLGEYETLKEAKQGINRWVQFYNSSRLHSALGYKTPLQFNREGLRNSVA
jgi:putative transposase